MTHGWRLRALRWTFALFIVYASAETFLQTTHGGHAAFVIKVLAGSEILAATVLATGFFDLAASSALVATFTIAGAITVGEGEWPLRFIYYSATALLFASKRAPQASEP